MIFQIKSKKINGWNQFSLLSSVNRILCIFILILSKSVNCYKFLSNKEWVILRNYIKSSDTTLSMRDKVDTILFYKHLPFVNKKVNNFKRFHYRKCKHIDKYDLLVCGYKSLYDSVKKYNGDFTFYNYVDKYIQGSLYKVMTEHYPISKISKLDRRKSLAKRNTTQYNYLPNLYLQNKDIIQSPNNNKYEHTYENGIYDIWEIIDEFDPYVRKMFYYKFDFNFNKVRSNCHISKILCCSEEHVRKTMKNHIYLIKSKD